MTSKAFGYCLWWDDSSQEGMFSVDGFNGIYFNNEGKPRIDFEHMDFVEATVVVDTTFQQVSAVRRLTRPEIDAYVSDKLLAAFESDNHSELHHWLANSDFEACKWERHGKVLWYDARDGNGMIRSEGGFYFYFSDDVVQNVMGISGKHTLKARDQVTFIPWIQSRGFIGTRNVRKQLGS